MSLAHSHTVSSIRHHTLTSKTDGYHHDNTLSTIEKGEKMEKGKEQEKERQEKGKMIFGQGIM